MRQRPEHAVAGFLGVNVLPQAGQVRAAGRVSASDEFTNELRGTPSRSNGLAMSKARTALEADV